VTRNTSPARKARYSTLTDILDFARQKGEDPFVVLLDCIEDPQNLGAIIRTAECAGVHGVIIPDRHSASLSAGTLRASAGAVEHMRVAMASSVPNALNQLKREGLWTVAADMDGRRAYYDYRFKGPTALVIGGEDHGLGRLTKELCDEVVRIPMFGETPSLNASVSAAILIYEAVRQRATEGRRPRDK